MTTQHSEPHTICLPETTDATPVVGNAATYTVYTDAHACTIVAVSKSGKQLTLRRDRAVLLNGANSDAPDKLTFDPGGFFGHTDGTQRYRYEHDPEGKLIKVSLRSYGSEGRTVWKAVGQPTKSLGGTARLGKRAEHYDYNF